MQDYPFIARIKSPLDVKSLSHEEALVLCREIREFLADTVSKRGGHLASNLGVTELTVALHRVFDSPHDRLIFDVGHQSYVHKILTGRAEAFDTLRMPGGLSGFPRRAESEHDPFGTGHSSTSLSAALGFAAADALRGDARFTVAVVGDGAYTGGMIHEALNNCDKHARLLLVLNDNEMSISPNTGRFARYLSRIRMSRTYRATKQKTRRILSRIPLLGRPLTALFAHTKAHLREALYRKNYFEELGFSYFGPVDGHDLLKLEAVLREAKTEKNVTVVHVHTKKGKGDPLAEADPTAYHGVSPKGGGEGQASSFSAVAAEALTALADGDGAVCAVTAAMGEGTCLSAFAKKHPSRYFDVGIAEEHALTFSAGLAAAGMKPYFGVYATFLQRAYDNLLHDVALQGLPVRILVDRAGLSYGDGATHHGIFDIAFASHIPGITLLAPATYGSLRAMMAASGEISAPLVIRYPKGAEDDRVSRLFYPDGDYRGYGLRALGVKDPDAVIVACGTAVSRALDAVLLLGKANVRTEILLAEALAPYDVLAARVTLAVKKDIPIFFLEEGIRDGGAGMLLGERLSRVFAEAGRVLRYRILAIDGHFAIPDTLADLCEYCGIDGVSVARAVAEAIAAESLRRKDSHDLHFFKKKTHFFKKKEIGRT